MRKSVNTLVKYEEVIAERKCRPEESWKKEEPRILAEGKERKDSSALTLPTVMESRWMVIDSRPSW
jgi:hypothetical protein